MINVIRKFIRLVESNSTWWKTIKALIFVFVSLSLVANAIRVFNASSLEPTASGPTLVRLDLLQLLGIAIAWSTFLVLATTHTVGWYRKFETDVRMAEYRVAESRREVAEFKDRAEERLRELDRLADKRREQVDQLKDKLDAIESAIDQTQADQPDRES